MIMTSTAIIRELGDGLILRRSTPADGQKLFDFCSSIHAEDPKKPDERIGTWARDLVEKPHPIFGVGDYTIVEEQATGRIVSSLNHISQTWAYEGIPFKVGRPELVGTLPEFRNRGLIRLQFDEVHKWSAERGEMVQAITGIPYYYRLFGYEMCVDLDGSRAGFEVNLPKLKEGEKEPYRFRLATDADIPFMSEVYAYGSRRSLLSVFRDEAIWRYDLNGRSEKSIQRLVWKIVERADTGEPVGYIAHTEYSWGVSCPMMAYELKPGISWLDVTPSVVRHMWDMGKEVCDREGDIRSAFTFALAGAHPVYEVMRDSLPRVRQPYCWYLRVPDLPAFIRHITPVLERRLSESLIPGFSGAVRISFYRSGIRLELENGRLALVEPWQPGTREEEGEVAFPDLTFLQLVFGHRTLDELKLSRADVWWKDDRTRMLLGTLFPRKPSQFIPIA
jgi:hypothetical protein